MKTVEFEGVCSGDSECFCWEVDEETFIKIMNREPGEWDYVNVKHNFDDNTYVILNDRLRIYPNHIFGYDSTKLKMKISFKEIE